MSTKKQKKTPRGLPRMASKRRQEREEREAAVEERAPQPAPPPPPPRPAPRLPKRPDPLEEFVKSEQKKADLSTCTHKHLLFGKMGAEISCIDCKGRWHKVLPIGTIPDVGYFNPAMEMESRHTPFESPRITSEIK